jgi:hypothetical protein
MLMRMRGMMMARHPTAPAVGSGDGCCIRCFPAHRSGEQALLGAEPFHKTQCAFRNCSLQALEREALMSCDETNTTHSCVSNDASAAFDIIHTL